MTHSQDEEPSWTDGSKCHDMPKNFFFPEDGPGADRAAAFCWGANDEHGECPVRLRCLQYAIERNEIHGVWGGYGQRDRVRVRRFWQQTGEVKDLGAVKVLVRPPKPVIERRLGDPLRPRQLTA